MPEDISPLERGDDLLDQHLERLAESLETPTGGHSSNAKASEFATSDCPYYMEADFPDLRVSVVVAFRREGDQLRYSSLINRGLPTLSQGPTNLINVSCGLAAASDDIDAAFAKI